MIRNNLSTRPFYNERPVQIVLLALGLIALAATVFNVTRVIQLAGRDTQLASQAARDEAAAQELRRAATRDRGTVDLKSLERASLDAREANDLIDRRTFSWTELFNRFETTLPDDVRITAIQPKVDAKKGIVLTIVVAARGVDDVNQFLENLDATGAFVEVEAPDNRIDDQGQLEATLKTVYKPTAAQSAGAGGAR
jgi:Tfp pilus assembly protein PilN